MKIITHRHECLTLPWSSKKKHGFIYVIKCKSIFKLGITISPRSRIYEVFGKISRVEPILEVLISEQTTRFREVECAIKRSALIASKFTKAGSDPLDGITEIYDISLFAEVRQLVALVNSVTSQDTIGFLKRIEMLAELVGFNPIPYKMTKTTKITKEDSYVPSLDEINLFIDRHGLDVSPIDARCIIDDARSMGNFLNKAKI